MSQRIYQDTEVTIEGTFKNASNVVADPDTVTFTWQYEHDAREQSVTPSKQSTGVYRATFTPEYPGFIFYRWRGIGTLTTAIEDTFWIDPTRFPKGFNTRDYCGRGYWW